MFLQVLFLCGLTAALGGPADQGLTLPRSSTWGAIGTAPAPMAVEHGMLQTVSYSVVDLVIPIDSRPNLELEPLPCRNQTTQPTKEPASLTPLRMTTPTSNPLRSGFMPWHGETTGAQIITGHTLETDLVRVVTSRIAPKTWQEVGGRGTIQYYPLGMALVVTQTPAVHKEIKAVLASFRRQLDVQVALQVTVVQMSPASMERVRKEMELVVEDEEPIEPSQGPKWIVPAKGERWRASLDKDQFRRFLELTQEDRAATVMQAPKLTMFDGQIGTLEVSDRKLLVNSIEVTTDDEGNVIYKTRNEPVAHGLRLAMQPVVSKDHRSVRVALNAYWSEPAGPASLIPVQTTHEAKNDQGKEEPETFQMHLARQPFWQVHVRQKVDLPDAGTMLFHGGVVTVEERHTGIGGFISRVLGGSGRSSTDHHMLFMVTPRIVIAEEQAAP